MRVGAAVLTHNPIANDRMPLLGSAYGSLKSGADRVVVVDNGSTDGFAGGDWRNDGPNTTCGYGTYSCLRVVAGLDVDLCVVSDDDMFWTAAWATSLAEFWSAAPDDVLLAGGHLEPEFFWNTIEAAEPGVLWRASTGAASWTFRRRDYDTLIKFAQSVDMGIQGVWDVPVCQRIRRAGYRIAQLDLAEHQGRTSTWGNRTVDVHGWELGPVRERYRTGD